jgi:hypothetical protein
MAGIARSRTTLSSFGGAALALSFARDFYGTLREQKWFGVKLGGHLCNR